MNIEEKEKEVPVIWVCSFKSIDYRLTRNMVKIMRYVVCVVKIYIL